jgi:peptide deformylase
MIDHLSAGQRVAAMRDYQEALEAGAKPGDVAED